MDVYDMQNLVQAITRVAVSLESIELGLEEMRKTMDSISETKEKAPTNIHLMVSLDD